MVTFLSGGTGTPKLLAGLDDRFDDVTVVANTGDDVEMSGLLVCPDLDTVLYLGGDCLDTDTWWGIDEDSSHTHDHIKALAKAADLAREPRYLDEEAQTSGRKLSRWRRFSGVGEFMTIGDHDRAVHVTRTGLLDEGNSLTEVTQTLAAALDVPWTVLPMSDDPVATMIHTAEGRMHFQEYWVAHGGDPAVESVTFRGGDTATATVAVRTALTEPVIIGPSNPITSIGPMVAIDGIREALAETPVVAVSPFVEDQAFSGPVASLMAAEGYEASTAGVADAYPFADAFVLDERDGTDLDRPVVQTDTAIDSPADGRRVLTAAEQALEVVQ